MTTLTLINYSELKNRAWAFAQMGLAFRQMGEVPGLRFARLMGSGGGNGFALRPNWGVYCWMGHWDSAAAAEAYFTTNEWWRKVQERSAHRITFRLRANMTHGAWDGGNPFTPRPDAYDPEAPVAVITRATIRPRKLLDFWRYVPRTSASVYDHKERLLSVGVGEYPVFMQATFSVWTSGQAMRRFAYASEHHREVVKLTRQRDWYREEMFTRFSIVGITGSWPDFDPEDVKI